MAAPRDNDRRWLDVELGTRAIARCLECEYVPFSTKQALQKPAPSAPTDKHLYMLLPHSIGISPPAQSLDLVCVATMSAKTFFEYAAEKLGFELDNPPTHDDDSISVVFDGLQDNETRKRYRLTFTIQYCRVKHDNGHLLSAPEDISLDGQSNQATEPQTTIAGRFYNSRDTC